MIDGHLFTPADGTRGFDMNAIVTPSVAAAMYGHGYRFAVRYVPRQQLHDYDLTQAEAETILSAGLGLMVVQHVAEPGWSPAGTLGQAYGFQAARSAQAAGLPPGTMLWLDLEGVGPTTEQRVIDYCNDWHTIVAARGYLPGLYVGYGAGLDAASLYRELRFTHYWSAYNLDRPDFPAVRGVQMRQSAAGKYDRPSADVAIPEFDVDVVGADALGGRVQVLASDNWPGRTAGRVA